MTSDCVTLGLPSLQMNQNLHDIMALMGDKKVAINSFLSYSEERLVVDEFRRTPDGGYVLTNASVDILRQVFN